MVTKNMVTFVEIIIFFNFGLKRLTISLSMLCDVLLFFLSMAEQPRHSWDEI